MGLLSAESGEKDLAFAFRTAVEIQRWWNEKQAGSYGFELALYKQSVAHCCELVTRLFDGNYFSNPPGPFKRAAAFVVIGRLYPFFQMVPVEEIPTEQLAHVLLQMARERHAWLARFMTLAIPAILRRTKAQIGDDDEWKVLSDWNGFPSLHYKLEFLAWLRWLETLDNFRQNFTKTDWDLFTEKRLARLIMSLSLMIEACYYYRPSGDRSGICGNIARCLRNLEEEHELDILYDTPILVKRTARLFFV